MVSYQGQVTFPAARSGDVVTCDTDVFLHADEVRRATRELYLNEGLSASFYTTATSVHVTCRRTSETLTVTSDAPTATGAVAPSAGSSAVTWTAVKTANYAASAGDAVLADASGGAFNVTLPAPAANARVTVKNIGATGTVTVLPHAAETIDGGASYSLMAQWMSRDFQSDGANWLVV